MTDKPTDPAYYMKRRIGFTAANALYEREENARMSRLVEMHFAPRQHDTLGDSDGDDGA